MAGELEPSIGERRGGARSPFLRALRRLGLLRRDGTPRTWAIVGIAWGPLLLGGLLRATVGDRPVPILFDLSVHARLVIGIPLLLLAGRLFARLYRDAIEQLYAGDFADHGRLDQIVARSERVRDSGVALVIILVLAVVNGQAALWGAVGPTGLFAGVSDAGGISFARVWYVTVGLPIVQFLFLRWLWQWALWSYVLFRLSRLRLATNAAHPDLSGGIGFLSAPIAAFAAFVLAMSTMMASAWGTQILAGRVSVPALAPTFVAFVLLVAVIACGPLLLFIPTLCRTRIREVRRYNELALRYVQQFQLRWVGTHPGAELLGTPDLQSLNDLIGACQSVADVRPVPFGKRELLMIWGATVLPMIPLVATTMPLSELIAKLARGLLAGLPL